MIYELGHRGSQ